MAVQGLLLLAAAAGEEVAAVAAAVVVELHLGIAPRVIVGGHRDTIECSSGVDFVGVGVGVAVAGIVACRVHYDLVLVDRTVVVPFPFFVVVPFPFQHLPRLLLCLVASSAD